MPILFTKSGDIDYMAEHGAGARLDYGLDWSSFLAQLPGDSIAASAWASNHPDLQVDSDAVNGAVTSAFLSGGHAGRWYSADNTITTVQGRRETRTCFLFVRDSSIGSSSVFFPDRMAAIASMRRDYLPALMAGYGKLSLTDQFIWSRLLAAEAHIAHKLRVPLQPTLFTPVPPTPAELAALGGKPWAIDPPYDLDPGEVQYGGTRFFRLRQIPAIEIHSIEVVYPGQDRPAFVIPPRWLRLDGKYGHLQIVPIGSSFGYAIPSAGMALSVLSGGANVPHVFYIRYTAGLENVATAYPDLLDIGLRLTTLGILRARVMPNSGSISADGLSESYSAPDFGNLQDQIDDELDKIRASIVGQRFTVL